MTKMSTEAFQEVVLNNFKNATDQRKEDKKDIHTRIDRMEKKHTETYTAVFKDIRENGEAIITNQTNIENAVKSIDGMKKKSAGIGGASGLGGGAMILAAKEFWNTFVKGN